MNIHTPPKALRVTAKHVAFAGLDAAPKKRIEFAPSASALTALLDKTIALLMVAIALTLAWPVGMAVWGQSRAAREASRVCRSVPDASIMSDVPLRCIQSARAA